MVHFLGPDVFGGDVLHAVRVLPQAREHGLEMIHNQCDPSSPQSASYVMDTYRNV